MRAITLSIILTAASLAGCVTPVDEAIGDDNMEMATDPTPRFELPDIITGIAPLASLDLGGGGTGIWIDEERNLLYSANHGAGVSVIDISDPTTPVVLAVVGDIYARDVDILQLGNQSLVIAAGAAEGMHVIDVTDPVNPVLLATASEYSVHNVASVPGTPYVYDSGGGPRIPGERRIPVLDLTDPAAPTWHIILIPTTVNGVPIQSNGCHDITVRVDLGRAYCAGGGNWYAEGGGETFIWDISKDPLNPSWEGVIDNPFIIYHHQAIPTADGNILLINDEYIAPNCHAADVGPLTLKQPTAAMWVYDISDPVAPVMLSYVQPNVEGNPQNCGSHFGDLVDGTSVIAWAWYDGGTLLIDIADPANPVILDRQGTGSTWDARYSNGLIYGSSDTLQVFRLI